MLTSIKTLQPRTDGWGLLYWPNLSGETWLFKKEHIHIIDKSSQHFIFPRLSLCVHSDLYGILTGKIHQAVKC
jgi:hypothetical protein